MILVRQMLREYGYIALGYFAVMQLALVAAVYYWPEFRENISAVVKLIPFEPVREMVDAIQEGGFWAYFSLQQFFKGVNLFGLAAAAIFGTGLVAREADNRTAEFLLSRPVSRARILLVRWCVGAVLLAVPVLVSSVVGNLLAPAVEERTTLGPVLAASAYTSLFLIALFTLTVYMSAHFEHQLKAGVILVGLGLLQFALYLVQSVGDFSLFQLVDMDPLLGFAAGRFPWVMAGGLAASTLLFLGLALRQFERRDF